MSAAPKNPYARLDPDTCLDPNARVEFLRLGADVWRKRASSAPDPDAAQRARAYEAALKEAESQQ